MSRNGPGKGRALVILITGASSGIGRSAAEELLRGGHIVYGASRRVERMAVLEPQGLRPIRLDITCEQQCEDALAGIIAEQGRIDVLINSAGYGVYGSIEEVPLQEARGQFEVNLFGLAKMTRLALPYMRKQHSGRIINISSIGGKIYTPFGGWYHASKHALEGWSDCLRLEVEPLGIDVVIIEPGAVKSEWEEIAVSSLLKTSGERAYAAAAKAAAEYFERIYRDPRTSRPEIVAKTVRKAVEAKRPKTRYQVGHMAKVILLVRKWTGDRIFDRILRKQMAQ